MSQSNTAAGEQCGYRWGGSPKDTCRDNGHLSASPHICRCVVIFTMEEYSAMLRTGARNYIKVIGEAKRARHRDHECSCRAKP